MWSKELQDNTRENIFPGAIMKNENHDYGFYFENAGKIEIKGVEPGGFMPTPSDEVIAVFNSVEEMIENGWVLD